MALSELNEASYHVEGIACHEDGRPSVAEIRNKDEPSIKMKVQALFDYYIYKFTV